MNCDPLPNTGLDANVGLFLILAVICLIAGTVLLWVTRQRTTAAPAALLIILVVGAAIALTPGPPAQAATSDCATSNNSLTVTQTSVMENLAPGTAPVPITGLVVNNGTDSTHITAVLVEITSVTASPRAPAGTCNASDYVLVDPQMPVDRTLSPRASTPFAGASIGFSNKTTNQDACKHATIHLLYTVNLTVPNRTDPRRLNRPGRG